MTDAELITKTLEHMIQVLQAFKDGKTIQIFDTDIEKWFDDENPSFDFSCERYRIKPDRQPQPGEPIAVFGNVAQEWRVAIFERMLSDNIIAASLVTRDTGKKTNGYIFSTWKFITEQPL